MFVNVLFCYINGVVLICDWNDALWNENIEIKLKEDGENCKAGGEKEKAGFP